MRHSVLALSLFAAVGAMACNKVSPCNTYVDAVAACYGATDSDAPPGYDAATACESGVTLSDAYYGCLADAYKDGDCSTEDGTKDIAKAIGACTP